MPTGRCMGGGPSPAPRARGHSVRGAYRDSHQGGEVRMNGFGNATGPKGLRSPWDRSTLLRADSTGRQSTSAVLRNARSSERLIHRRPQLGKSLRRRRWASRFLAFQVKGSNLRPAPSVRLQVQNQRPNRSTKVVELRSRGQYLQRARVIHNTQVGGGGEW